MAEESNFQVVRYKQWCAFTHRHEMMEDPEGQWVLYYVMQAQIERLRASEAELLAQIKSMRTGLDDALDKVRQRL